MMILLPAMRYKIVTSSHPLLHIGLTTPKNKNKRQNRFHWLIQRCYVCGLTKNQQTKIDQCPPSTPPMYLPTKGYQHKNKNVSQ